MYINKRYILTSKTLSPNSQNANNTLIVYKYALVSYFLKQEHDNLQSLNKPPSNK